MTLDQQLSYLLKGMAEIIREEDLRERLVAAIEAGDTQALDRFGRFLAPFMQQVKANASPVVAKYLAARSEAAQREFYSPSCVH